MVELAGKGLKGTGDFEAFMDFTSSEGGFAFIKKADELVGIPVTKADPLALIKDDAADLEAGDDGV